MTEDINTTRPYRLQIRKLFWLPLGVSAVLVFITLCGLVAVSWRGLERIKPVQAHLAHIGLIQDIGLSMEQVVMHGLRGTQITSKEVARLRESVLKVIALEGALHPDSKTHLLQIAERLTNRQDDTIEVLIGTLAQLRVVLDGERKHHDLLLTGVAWANQTELRLAAILLIVLPFAGGVLLLLVRSRIKQPLNDLGSLLMNLAAQDYRPVADVALNDNNSLVQPVFLSYNKLVSRLQALEAEHRTREYTLEKEVRQATETLLAQNRELARAERLAAVGAVSAGLAHELRNPLAGIQMACSKLRRMLGDKEEQATRIDSVIIELKRINGLLTETVDAARHAPEPLTKVRLKTLVDEFLVLAGYQIPEGIVLEAHIPDDLECLLPGGGLQQALLNLILNAVQVLGENGHITIVAKREGQFLELSVSDDGPGFPDEMLRMGIRPFATGRSGGTGLGLAMIRRFTREHDGDLELSNLKPQGAQITLRLICRAENCRSEGDESNG